MTGMGGRPPAGGASPTREGHDLSHQEATEYIASMLEGLRLVAQNAQMPFLAYLLNVALEAASTTTTPSEIPEINRLRRGKSFPRGAKPGDRSLMRSPRSPMSRCKSSLSGG